MVVLLCDVVGPVLVLDEADQPLERVVLELCAAREVALERLPDVRRLGSPRPGREPLERPLARVVEVDLLSTHTSQYTSHPSQKRVERRLGNDSLDLLEQHALFEAHVIVEERPERLQRLRRHLLGGELGPELAGEAVKLHVLAQDPREQHGVGFRLSRIEREHRLLLAAKVLDRLREEHGDVARGCLEPLVRRAVRGSRQAPRLHELLVVVVGQRDERRVPLHGRSTGLRSLVNRSSPRSVSVCSSASKCRFTASAYGVETRRAYAPRPSSRTGARSSRYGSRTCWRPT